MQQVTIQGSTTALAVAIAGSNPAAAAACYAEDAQLLAPGGGLFHGRAEIERFWRTGIEIGLASLNLEVLTCQQSWDLAYQIGRYELRLAPPESAPVNETGKYLVIHKRQHGSGWRLAVEFFAPDCTNERDRS